MKTFAICLALLLVSCGDNPVAPTPSPSPTVVVVPAPSPIPSQTIVGAAIVGHIEGSGSGTTATTMTTAQILALKFTNLCRDENSQQVDCDEQPIIVFWDPVFFPIRYVGPRGLRVAELQCDAPTDILVIAQTTTSVGSTVTAQFAGTCIQG